MITLSPWSRASFEAIKDLISHWKINRMIYKLKSPCSSMPQSDFPLNYPDDGTYISRVCSGFGLESRLLEEDGEQYLITSMNNSARVFYACISAFLAIWFVVFGPSLFAFFIEVSGLIWVLLPALFATFPAVLVRVKHQTDFEKLKRCSRKN